MKLALVTGASGWLGQALLNRLSKDKGRVIRVLIPPGTDRAAIEARAPGCQIVEGWIQDPRALGTFVTDAKDATLFHCAGIIHPKLFTKDLDRTNTQGTALLLEAAKKGGIGRVIVVSSNSPIGTNPNPDHVFDERAPYNPYMKYGRSKMLMEQWVHDYQKRGLDCVIVRPPWFYGPFQPPRQTLFFRMITNGKVPMLGAGENKRSMAYVDNICQGLLLCESTQKAKGQTYWIADKRPYSMKEIIDTVASVLRDDFKMDVKPQTTRLPSWIGDFAQGVDAAIQSLGLYQQKIHVLSEMNKTIACSIEKAQRELGYAPEVELREGMRRSVEWCLANGQVI